MSIPERPRRLSIRHLRAFVAVSHYGNLTRAAESLFVTQSALSLTIQHLEEDLGLALFDRTTRKFEPTQAGADFITQAKRLLVEFDSTIDKMLSLSKRERGKVGVAGVPSVMALLLPDAIAGYIAAFPDIDVYLREDNSEAVQQRIVDGDVDLGICSLLEPMHELEFEPLFEDSYGVVFSPDHPFSVSTDDIPWEQLEGQRIIGFSHDLGMQHQLSKTKELSQIIRDPRYRVSNTSSIEALVARNMGVSVISALAAKRAPLDKLNLRLLSNPTLSRKVGILRREGRSLSPAAISLLDYIRESVPSLASFPGVILAENYRLPDMQGDDRAKRN